MANILIAEDEEPIRELIRRSLALAGHTVRQAAVFSLHAPIQHQ